MYQWFAQSCPKLCSHVAGGHRYALQLQILLDNACERPGLIWSYCATGNCTDLTMRKQIGARDTGELSSEGEVLALEQLSLPNDYEADSAPELHSKEQSCTVSLL